MKASPNTRQDINNWAFYRNIFEFAHDAIFLETADGRIIDANDAACRLLKYSREELLTLNVADLLEPESRDRYGEMLQKELVDSGRSLEGRNLRKDGAAVPIEITVNSFLQGGEQYLVVIARDITERLGAEKVRRQNEYLTSLHEVSLGLLNRLDLYDLLNTVVARTCELFGTADGFVCLLDESRGVMEKRIGVGRYADLLGYTIKMGAGVVGRVWEPAGRWSLRIIPAGRGATRRRSTPRPRPRPAFR